MRSRMRLASIGGLVGGALALGLAGCASAGEAEPPSSASTQAASDDAAPSPAVTSAQTSGAGLSLDEAETNCGDAIFLWYPSGVVQGEPEYMDSWNWRFTGTSATHERKGDQWRFTFANNAATRGSPPSPDAVLTIDGVVQDGYADTWCETHPDGTYDVGIVGGASVTGKTMKELAAYMIERTREYLW